LTAATPNRKLVTGVFGAACINRAERIHWSSNREQINPARRRLRFGAVGFGRFRQNPGFLLGRQPGELLSRRQHHRHVVRRQ
jgi:hypothetical protein